MWRVTAHSSALRHSEICFWNVQISWVKTKSFVLIFLVVLELGKRAKVKARNVTADISFTCETVTGVKCVVLAVK
jgi:hypothetical protein